MHNLKPMCSKGYFAKGESIFLIVSENLRFCSFIIRLKSFCVTFFFLDVKVPAIFSPLSHTTYELRTLHNHFATGIPTYLRVYEKAVIQTKLPHSVSC